MSARTMGRFALSRRQLLAASSALAFSMGTRDGLAQESSPEAGGEWTFVDDAGVTITLPQRPQRVVAYVPLAASFWDFGVQPIGYYGNPLRADGTPETIAGDLDFAPLASLGVEYGNFDLEALVALNPDLIVNDMWDDPPTFWGLEPEIVAQINEIAPIANILFIDQPITETIARVEELAVALGADLDSTEVAAERAAFEQAVADLKAAIAAKPGLTAAFVSGVPEGSFWVGNPMKLADVRFVKELGLDIVQPEDQSVYSEELSWEQAGKYPADLFIIDSLHGSGTGEELVAKVPTFAALPAAKAGAFASWPSEYVPSYAGMTPVLISLTEAIRNADPDIV